MNRSTIIAKMQLRDRRIKAGFSLRELSRQAGITPASMSKVEQLRPINPSTAKKICTALNCDFDDLFKIQEVKNDG